MALRYLRAQVALGERWGYVFLTRPGRGEAFLDNPWAPPRQETKSRRDYQLSSPLGAFSPQSVLVSGKPSL